jgi:hypothetical protein
MDFFVAAIQIGCIAGLLYGLFLSVTCNGPCVMFISRLNARPQRSACNPSQTGARAALRAAQKYASSAQ